MELKELYQEIILDHGKIQEILANVKISPVMQRATILFVVIRFIFTPNWIKTKKF